MLIRLECGDWVHPMSVEGVSIEACAGGCTVKVYGKSGPVSQRTVPDYNEATWVANATAKVINEARAASRAAAAPVVAEG